MKTGRNDPCPCGSGKKYKKCCYVGDKANREMTQELDKFKTGSPLDEYFGLMRLIYIYSNMVMMGPDGNELTAASDEFEKNFKPGKNGWIPDSFYNNWLLFDLRFGKSGMTVCERYMEKEAGNLVSPGPENLEVISGSYFTFYSVFAISRDTIMLEDLYTGIKWKVQRIKDAIPQEERAAAGDVWFTRLVGTPVLCFNVATQFSFGRDSRDSFAGSIRGQVEDYMRRNPGADAEDAYAESCKESFRKWAYYMLVACGTVKRPTTGFSPGAAAGKKKKKSAKAGSAGARSLIFEIEICGIEPKIWRRFSIGMNSKLSTLAAVIMTLFDWSGTHLHEFRIGGKDYGVSDPDFPGVTDEKNAKLTDINIRDLKHFDFRYDFGDNWDHEIRYFGAEPAKKGVEYPVCIDGARAAPPEDCGGEPGYYQIIEALGKKPTDRDREETAKINWLPAWWKAELFEKEKLNLALKDIKKIEKQFTGYRKMMGL